jgi:urease accessory protein
MSGATSQSNFVPEAAQILDVKGRAEVGFAQRDGETRLAHLYQHDPIRILFPNTAPGESIEATVITTSGGLVGGDEISLEISAGPKSIALVSAQAAEKIYRSSGATTDISVAINAEEDSWLEWLPQETILFDGSKLRRKTVINASRGAHVLAGEILVLGRTGSGEVFSTGFLQDAWEVNIDNRLIWADALCLDNNIPSVLSHPACFDGATALATAVYVCDNPAEHIEAARKMLSLDDSKVLTSATVVNGVLVLRWLGKDAYNLRQAFAEFWKAFRHYAGGRPAELPRLWYV